MPWLPNGDVHAFIVVVKFVGWVPGRRAKEKKQNPVAKTDFIERPIVGI